MNQFLYYRIYDSGDHLTIYMYSYALNVDFVR